MSKNFDSKEPEVLAAWYGQKAFVKVKQALNIGKILFSFVSLEKPSDNIDCYMTAEEFGALLMTDVKNRSIFRQLAEEKAKGEQYPKAVWTSPIGGSETGGKTISRYFNIAPGMKTDAVLTALCYPADKSNTGAYIQKQGAKPIITLRVPCTNSDLKILQYKWSFLEADYMSKKYNVENTSSTYRKQNEEKTPKNDSSNSSIPSNEQQGQQEHQSQEILTDMFKTKNLIADMKNGGKYLYACRRNDQNPIAVVFLDEKTKASQKWEEFVETSSRRSGITFRIRYSERNGKCYFLGFV